MPQVNTRQYNTITRQLKDAYAYSLDLTKRHYENFPVASLVLPERLRQPISVIYAFARTADDFADEGTLDQKERLYKLDEFHHKLNQIESGVNPTGDLLFLALADTISTHHLPISLFKDLIFAFRQDVTKVRYSTYQDVLFYCKHSANPIGRLLLHLVDAATPDNLTKSDAICTSLQIINFLQDIGQDYDENNRIYLPQQEMQHFNVNEDHFRNKCADDNFRSFIQFQIQRTKILMLTGAPLGLAMPGRFGWQLRIMINSGIKVLELLEIQTQNYFSRPRLKFNHWMNILWRTIVLTKFFR